MKKYNKPTIVIESFITNEIMAGEGPNILSDLSPDMNPKYSDPLGSNVISFKKGNANLLNSIDYQDFLK